MERMWIWLIAGLLLLGLELLSGTFILLFFGLGALITAGLCLFGMEQLYLELVVFSLSSLVLIFAFRKKLSRQKKSEPPPDIGKSFHLSASLPAMGEAMVSYQGTLWTAVNQKQEPIEKGSMVRIKSTDGIKIIVEKV